MIFDDEPSRENCLLYNTRRCARTGPFTWHPHQGILRRNPCQSVVPCLYPIVPQIPLFVLLWFIIAIHNFQTGFQILCYGFLVLQSMFHSIVPHLCLIVHKILAFVPQWFIYNTQILNGCAVLMPTFLIYLIYKSNLNYLSFFFKLRIYTSVSSGI